MIAKLALLVISALSATVVGFALLEPDAASLALRHSIFVILLLAVALYLAFLLAEYRTLWHQTSRSPNFYRLLLLSLGATTFLFTREEPGYKVVFDEPVLINTSYNLHLDRDPVMEGRLREDVHTEAIRLDKRPFLFPFLISLTHDLLGYRVANGHIVNFLLTLGLLGTVFGICRALSGTYAGVASILLFCALPILSQNASGLGMELLNLFLLAVTHLTALHYFKSPTDRRMNILLLSAILLAHSRYESAIYAIAIGLIILITWWKQKEVSITWLLVTTPLFFIPIAWQQIVIWSDPSYMQLSAEDTAFNPSNICKNLKHSLQYFFLPDESMAGSAFLSYLCFASLMGGFCYVIKQRKRVSLTTIILSLFTLIIYIMLMAYFWGQVTDNMVTRLTLPIWLLLIIPTAIVLSKLASIRPWFPPLILAGAILFALPIINKHAYTKKIPVYKRYDWCERNLNPLLTKDSLVITHYSFMYRNIGIASMSFSRALGRATGLHTYMNLDTWDNIYVIQAGHMKMENGAIVDVLNDGYDLGPAFELETLDQISLIPFNFIRISKLTSINKDYVFNPELREKFLEPYLNIPQENVYPISAEADNNWRSSMP